MRNNGPMPTTKDVGRFFTHRMEYPSTDFPLIDLGVTQEIDFPFRLGRSVIFRIPCLRHAVVVGRWGEAASDPDAALTHALRLFRKEGPDVAVS